MKYRRNLATAMLAALGMLVLILDSRTALSGAQEGIDLSVRTVIPALFPFFLFSIILTGELQGRDIALLSPLRRLCGIPEGGESLLAVGLLGGYPVGASCIAAAYRNGQLKKRDAHRLLGFCSNAGPAFIFGMGANLFSSPICAWVLWGIHIASALLVGMLLPGKRKASMELNTNRVTLPGALGQAIRITASVCGWVILFRIVNAFFSRWFLWIFPNTVQVMITGLLELANGCCSLNDIASEALRFILFSGFLGFGGICVALQTVTVTEGLGTGLYFPGKLLQGLLSITLSVIIAPVLFPAGGSTILTGFCAVLFLIPAFLLFFLINAKKTVAFQEGVVYNE